MPDDPCGTTTGVDGLDDVGVTCVGSPADDVDEASGDRDSRIANADVEQRHEPEGVAIGRGKHAGIVASGRSASYHDELSVDCNRREVRTTCRQLANDRGSPGRTHALSDRARRGGTPAEDEPGTAEDCRTGVVDGSGHRANHRCPCAPQIDPYDQAARGPVAGEAAAEQNRRPERKGHRAAASRGELDIRTRDDDSGDVRGGNGSA